MNLPSGQAPTKMRSSEGWFSILLDAAADGKRIREKN
jgi:hypothetical protein